MITIKEYNRKSLQEFIDSPDFKALPFLPISRHRAISHIHNPRASDRDTLLMLAFNDDQLVGYLGVLPDRIYDREGNKSKCGWLSCMWIDPQSRGLGISKKLVAQALKSWDHKILVTEFTYPAKRLYDKTEAFKDLQIMEGIRLYIRSDLNKLLPPKGGLFQNLKSWWKVIDKGVNLLLDRRFLFYSGKQNFQQEYISHLDNEILDLITTRQENQIFRRSLEELNWILTYPWILSAPADEMSKKYHFSSVAGQFEFRPLKLRNSSGQLIAFIIFSRRDDSLKIPYCYFDQNDIDQVTSCIRWHLIHWRISTCTIFQRDLVNAFRISGSPGLHKKLIKRHYIISKMFTKFSVDDIYEIQDGDADCAFT